MVDRSAMAKRLGVALFAMSAVALAGGMGGCRETGTPTELQTIASRLRAESDLTKGCYTYTPGGASAKYNLPIAVGEPAIDFTLRTPSGEAYTLSALLETKPVMMVFGAFT